MQYDVFISYSRKDTPIAEKFVKRLMTQISLISLIDKA